MAEEKEQIESLQEKIAILEGFVGHRGWNEWLAPKVGNRLKEILKLLLSDIGDAQRRADFWRGQTNILNWIPAEAATDLIRMRNQLQELTKPEEQIIDPETGESLRPPI